MFDRLIFGCWADYAAVTPGPGSNFLEADGSLSLKLHAIYMGQRAAALISASTPSMAVQISLQAPVGQQSGSYVSASHTRESNL